MSFIEGHIEEEKVFNRRVFPKVLLPSVKTKCSTNDLVEMVNENKEWISKTLNDHGAILLRGFDVASADDFSRVIQAFGWDEFCYEGAADRVKLAERVYTANAIPLSITIPFHHEMAQLRKHAPKIMFFCLIAPPEGGQTSIIPSNVIVEKLEEEKMQRQRKLEEDGIIITLRTHVAFQNDASDPTKGSRTHVAFQNDASDPTKGSLVWQRMLKTKDKLEAEKRAMQMIVINSVKIYEDGSADFIFGPVNPIKEIDIKRVMFHNILPYEFAERNRCVSYGDGTPIPKDVTDARRPGKPPREVLVSLSY